MYEIQVPKERLSNIEAVSLDMSRSYCQSILQMFPNAKPVIDRFHIAQQLNKRVDDARKHIQNHVKKYDKKNEVFKIRWAMLKNVEDLKKEEAAAFIEYYKGLVAEYDIPELKAFCKTLDNWQPYILNYYDFRISNGLTEGNNHKVKDIKRRAYGYRNSYHFDLRVKLEFECA